MTPSTATIRIGRQDHGRRMSLDDFDQVRIADGIRVELGRGIIEVSEIPLPPHLMVLDRLRRLLHAFEQRHPRQI